MYFKKKKKFQNFKFEGFELILYINDWDFFEFFLSGVRYCSNCV